ncbi:MAG: C39 family peptidase [Candidatus Thiodiazotropha sp.]
MPLTNKDVRRIAGLEINALNYSRALPDIVDGAKIKATSTPIYDINGVLLFRRFSLTRGRSGVGYADVATNEIFGEPLLSTSIGAAWDEKAIIKEAAKAAGRHRRSLKYDRVRFVSYSFPKIAVQFLKRNKEVLMLEWGSWKEVPPIARGREPMQPSNFERWSLIEEMPKRLKQKNTRKFKKRIGLWDTRKARKIDPSVIKRKALDLSKITIKLVDTREIHYSSRLTDHYPCYELRGQQTGVWCVAASAEMLLNFYRYQYDQIRLADELGLGTCAHPNGLPYSQVATVVTVLENLTSNNLDVTMHVNPGWSVFRNEIRANRPLISFVPGHSRTVAGYTQSMLYLPGKLPFKGLLVYDPWPPTDCSHPDAGGVITKWENFNTQTYQYAYSAELQHI